MSRDDFGRWLRVMRIRQGLSQQDLANELEVDQTTVSRLERGAQGMSASLAAAIARVFNMSIDDVWLQAEPDRDDTVTAAVNMAMGRPPQVIVGSGIPSVGESISQPVQSVARRIEALPAGERRRALAYIRAILAVAEDDAERDALRAQLAKDLAMGAIDDEGKRMIADSEQLKQ